MDSNRKHPATASPAAVLLNWIPVWVLQFPQTQFLVAYSSTSSSYAKWAFITAHLLFSIWSSFHPFNHSDFALWIAFICHILLWWSLAHIQFLLLQTTDQCLSLSLLLPFSKHIQIVHLYRYHWTLRSQQAYEPIPSLLPINYVYFSQLYLRECIDHLLLITIGLS